MNRADPISSSSLPASFRSSFVAAGLLGLAAIAAYHNALTGPFVFDDNPAILENSTIRQWRTAFSPPNGTGLTVSGRPVLNFSLALNYAISGPQVWSYHALNLGIHLLAGLTLFGLVRHTLRLRGGQAPSEATVGRGLFPTPHDPSSVPPPPSTSSNGSPQAADGSRIRENADSSQGLTTSATIVAFFVALLWTVHPLQTESVTYIVQRAESLMGLFYLLTLYGFARSVQSARPGLWQGLSVLACLLGMATKEVMVSAPVIVLLYDRTFVAGGFREAWRQRRRFYLGLAATWLLLGWLVANTGGRGRTSGFGVGVGFWQYAATQFEAVARYLWLTLWPHPLILDYGAEWVKEAAEVVPYAAVVAVVVAATLVALRRRPACGFLGFWFLAILAPTSLIPGMRQTIVEHRMYLALVPVLVFFVVVVHRWLGRRSWIIFLVAAAGLGWTTAARNQDYRSDLAIWRDTVAKRPQNAGARNNLGNVLLNLGQLPEALGQYQEAARLKPNDSGVYFNAGNVLSRLGRTEEAIGHYRAALEINPHNAAAHENLGDAFFKSGRLAESIRQYEILLSLRPDSAEAHYNLANVLFRAGQAPDSLQHYETALRLKPDYAEAHYNLGTALYQLGRLPEAKDQFEQALRFKPAYSEAHNNLGNVLLVAGDRAKASAHYEAALRIDPANADAHINLGNIMILAGNFSGAVDQYETALRINPGNAEAHNNLGLILEHLGRFTDAKAQFEEAVRLRPDYSQARENLARVQVTK